MQRSIRVRKAGWMVDVQKGQGEVWYSNGWKDKNNEMDRGRNREKSETFFFKKKEIDGK